MEQSKRIFFKTEEVVKKTKVGWVEIDLNFQHFYHNAWKYVAQLNGVCSRDFLLWILGKLDDSNRFVYNRSLYREFIEELRLASSGREYEENTVHLALREFIDKGLAVKISRGIYRINPGIFNPEELMESMVRVTPVKQLNESKRTGGEDPMIKDAEKQNIITKVVPVEDEIEAPELAVGGLFSFDTFVD